MTSELIGSTVRGMPELRTEKITAVLTPTAAARLDAYRERHHWSRSTAIAVLVEQGLDRDEESGASQ